MKRKPTANPSSLFLLELIFAILFFSVASAVCVQIFVKSHTLSTQASRLTTASRLTEDVAELLTASTSPDDSKALLKKTYADSITFTDESFTVFYDSDLSPCQEDTASYQLCGVMHLDGYLLDTQLDFLSLDNGSSVYRLSVQHHMQRRPEHEK